MGVGDENYTCTKNRNIMRPRPHQRRHTSARLQLHRLLVARQVQAEKKERTGAPSRVLPKHRFFFSAHVMLPM